MGRVRSMHQASSKTNAPDVWHSYRRHAMKPEEEKIYGTFYTAFRKETWWWESTVAARKIVIALIGVFGTELKDMQVHLTLIFVVFILLATSQVRPFGGLKHGVLHMLEMASLMATVLTLWAGSVFNTRPRCEDPLKGEGSTLVWCDAMSVMVGMVDIVVLAAIGVCFVYMKVKSTSVEAVENEVENEVVPAVDSSKKKRRLSSRELMMVDMTNQNNDFSGTNPMPRRNNTGANPTPPSPPTTTATNQWHRVKRVTNGTGAFKHSGKQRAARLAGGDAVPGTTPPPGMNNTSATLAHWNTLKKVTKTSGAFRQSGKKRIKRLSKIMRSRDVAAASNVEIFSDGTGRKYSYNKTTKESVWLDEEESGVAIEEQGETKQKQKRQSFRKIVGDDKAVFFQNVETGETVWNRPVDSELVF